MRIYDSSKREALLRLVRDKGEACPSCGSTELWTDGTLDPVVGGVSVRLSCPKDPHPYPLPGRWHVTLSAEDLRSIGIDTSP